MKKAFLFSVFCISIQIQKVYTQAPLIEWEKSIGGTETDLTSDVIETIDGGFILVGSTRSLDGDVTINNGNGDVWIVKLNSAGIIQWQKALGGSENDAASSVGFTSDGGYIVAGSSASNNGDVTNHHGSSFYHDYWVVKLDSTGTIEWQKSLGGTDDEGANSVQQTQDGGYIVGGYSKSTDGDVSGHHGNAGTEDYWILKLNSNGAVQWQKSLGGANVDSPHSIIQILEGGYIVAGSSHSTDGDITGNHGGEDSWIVKLDVNGIIQWQNAFGGTSDERSNSIQQTADRGFIIVGNSYSADGDLAGIHPASNDADIWVLKLDSMGSIQWQKCYGGTRLELGYSICQTNDGGYVFGAITQSNDGDVVGFHEPIGNFNLDSWVVKLDSIGNMQWQKPLGGTSSELSYSLKQTLDGGYIVANSSGSNDGDVTGHHGAAGYGLYDFWIVKLSGIVGIEEQNPNTTLSLYPNPTQGQLFIQSNTKGKALVMVYDAMGKLVLEQSCFNQEYLDIRGFSKGLYMLKYTTEEGSSVQRFVVGE